ncbi:Clavaminate synthase-like protein [Ascobolus immersus RN42]|uniref:Trimethyllysine dioxygenase n=1 Tax=Ascobolus immersus RN42 TaxID=1160509 RepID=A0A3N4ILY5_ASCIM|nr:Clavaminate synthase-like protein [Ascobolus immersus RN42]
MFARAATQICRSTSARIASKTTPKVLSAPAKYAAASPTKLSQIGGCRHKAHFAPPDKTVPVQLPAQRGNTKRVHFRLYGEPISFDYMFLRDACHCPKCVNPSTQQKTFASTDLSAETKPAKVEEFNNKKGLRITWEGEDAHVSEYPVEWLIRYSSKRNRLHARFNNIRQTYWDKAMMEEQVRWFDYDAYMKEDEALFEVLKTLERYGLVFLRGVPTEVDSVATIAKRIGPLKNTFYGETWDVKSIADAKNVAYTNEFLGLHMDLLYFQSPPGIQLLHCMKNDATGGSSIFSDSFRAARALQTPLGQASFLPLTQYPVTFHYKNDGQHYHYRRPIIVLNDDPNVNWADAKIDHVNWSPPFQGPFEENCEGDDHGKFRLWWKAAKTFAEEVEHPDNIFELTLREGECVLFANRRVLHGRKEFDPSSGDRWLRGTYLDIDSFRSKLRVVAEQFHGPGGQEHPGEKKKPVSSAAGYEFA